MSDATLHELYDRDFYEWTQAAAAALLASTDAALDREHLADEIESMGKSHLHGVESRILRILEHKLKLTLTRGIVFDQNRQQWRLSVLKQQQTLERVLRDSPSLRARVPSMIAELYTQARSRFELSYGITAPEICPWSVREILEEN